MDNELRQATKAQAQAVREYLAGIGHDISHTQALEVLARGQGLRSRQVLAAQVEAANTTVSRPVRDANLPKMGSVQPTMGATAPATSATLSCTQVRFGYVDGSNCKRFSQMTFYGRLRPEQLRLIALRLDEGRYFIPAQVGFENLRLAFTDDGGDDHPWHVIELNDESEWVLDDKGYVLDAGGVRQIFGAKALESATDADCDNLTWRFARVLRWNESGQERVLTRDAWRPPAAPEYTAQAVARVFASAPELKEHPEPLLCAVAQALLNEGFTLSVQAGVKEMRRELGPNAYQYCLLEAPEAADRSGLWLNFDVTTIGGTHLTHTPRLYVDTETRSQVEQLAELARQISAQREAVKHLPALWDKMFDD